MLQDADGKISMEEFKNACLNQEQFSKMLALKVLYFIIITNCSGREAGFKMP
jgi:hypothetical protein